MAQITDTELISMQLQSNSPVSTEEIIKDLIQTDVASEIKQDMFDGTQYYKSKNVVINARDFSYFSNGMLNKDTFRANNKIANGFLKVIIDQKINYSLSKPFIIKGADNCLKLFDVNTLLRKTCKEASKKGVEWVHTYINKNGEFKVINISGQEIIPIYDNSFDAELLQIIRYYTVLLQEGKDTKQRYKVEVWDKEKVTYYMQDSNSKYYLDIEVDPNPMYHWQEVTTQLGELTKIEGHGWGKVPFVPLWNNDEHTNDLEQIKAHIDMYDIIISDFSNNLEDLQDAVIKLKNYSGVTENMGEFLEYLKRYKVLPLDSEGDAEYLTTEIPIEARKEMLSILRDNIFEFGQGVDVNKTGDGNITNVVIRNRYAGLDLKANDTEARIKEFLKEIFWFCNEYLKLTSQQQDDINKFEITFNRSLIINLKETIESVVASKGIISDRTVVANHPWVEDVDKELKEMDTDKEKQMELLGGDDIDDGGFRQSDGTTGEKPTKSADKGL
ncbi:MAG: hypothetical protein RLZZ577_91 [Bacteroidota bacterium]